MFDFSVKFEAIDRVSAKIDAINAKMNGMKSKADEVSQRVKSRVGNMKLMATLKMNTQKALNKLRAVENKVRQVGQGGKKMAQNGVARLVAGAGTLATLLQPLNVARKYELAFKDVKKAVEGTPEQLAVLREEMKRFKGASFEELGAVYAESGKMGFDATKVSGFANDVIKGAKALDFSAEMAVGQVGKILAMTNQMDTAVESSNDIMNKVVNLENNLAGVKGAGVIDIWKRNADMYSQLNFDNETMGAMSGFLEQSFVSSELGASGFKMMINQFKKLEGKFGFLEHIKANGLEGLKDVMAEISKMSPEEQIKTFGSGAMDLINKLQNKQNIAKLDFALQVSKDSAGAVQKEWELFRATFDERMNDSQKKVANLMDTLGDPMKKIASDFLGFVNPIIDKINNWVSKNKELAGSIMKWGAVIGGILAVLGVLAVVMGVVGMAIGALSPIMVLLTGKFGLLTMATWLMNAAFWANPITWIIAGVIALVGAVVALIYYWEEITAWVGMLWDKFMGIQWVQDAVSMFGDIVTAVFNAIMLPFELWLLAWQTLFEWVGKVWGQFGGFQGALGLVQEGINLVGGAFDALIAPIKNAIAWIDSFLSKFDIYNKAKEKVSAVGDSISDGASSAWGWVKEKTGFGNDDESANGTTLDNTVKNHSVIDVNVTATGGATADTASKSTGAVNLRTVENGIGGA